MWYVSLETSRLLKQVSSPQRASITNLRTRTCSGKKLYYAETSGQYGDKPACSPLCGATSCWEHKYVFYSTLKEVEVSQVSTYIVTTQYLATA